jgi:hypothetical protein
MNELENVEVIGKSYSNEEFSLVEDNLKPNLEIIDQMLRGEGPPVYVVRNYLSTENNLLLKNKFHDIISKSKGGNRNDDDYVDVYQIGANQFGKSGGSFIKDCIRTKPEVNDLMSEIFESEIMDDFILERSLREYFFDKSIYFGPSYFKGEYSNLFTVRLWKNQKNTDLSLEAHEDLSQLNFAKEDGFEIHSVKNVVACNLCIDNDSDTDLLVWNISPDDTTKKMLNLNKTGYPYSLDLIEKFPHLKVKTAPGDLYFINANFLHAVSSSSAERRISLGRFIGFVNDKRVVYWT